jgi:hypothetical protein
LEKGANRGDATDLFFSGGVNSITSAGTSSGAANPNTKAYKGGTIIDTGISITNIGASSDSMSFTVSFGAVPPVPAPKPAPVPPPVIPPANQFALEMLTDEWASDDTAWTLYRISTSPPTLIASRSIGYYDDNTLYKETYNLANGVYQFNLTDAFGDGLLSPGYYTLSLGSSVLKNGGVFTYLDSTKFTVGTVPVPKPAPATAPKPAPAPVPKPAPVKPVSAPKPAPVPAPKPAPAPVPKPAPIKPAKPAPIKPTKPAPKPAKPAPKPVKPTSPPVKKPSRKPSGKPSAEPTEAPTEAPSAVPSSAPSGVPSATPSARPSAAPSVFPSAQPTIPCKGAFALQNNSTIVTLSVTVQGNVIVLNPGDNIALDGICGSDTLVLEDILV